MGIKDFFRKVGRGIKNFAGKVWSGLKRGAQIVGKVAKPILSIAKPVLEGMSMAHGKVGKIGQVGAGIVNTLKGIVDNIPNQAAKDKLNTVIDRGKGVVDTVQQKAEDVTGKIKPWADMGLKLMNNPPPNPIM